MTSLLLGQTSVNRASADTLGHLDMRGMRGGEAVMVPMREAAIFEGRVFMACDASGFADTVTGQTLGAVTTPTFLLSVPTGTSIELLSMYLGQTGTVAGGVITVNMNLSSTADAYASGGTSETVFGARSDRLVTPACTMRSGATATTALLTKQIRSWTLGQDVSTAEGAVAEVLWTPEKQGHPIIIVGPAALGVFTYASTTGPTWNWSFSWLELPSTAVV